MARPVHYTDSDIRQAIQALAAEGLRVNPSRVRFRLGGGGIARITALVDEHLRQTNNASSGPDMPEPLTKEFRRAVTQAADNLLKLAQRSQAQTADVAGDELRNENATLKSRNRELEALLSAADARSGQHQAEIERQGRELTAAQARVADLVQQCEGLRDAVRNAESDLRASQKVIETFDLNQRRDRDEIRSLHKRVEGLVAELAEGRASRSRR